MPKLVLKSEVSDNIDLLTQIAEMMGFEVSVKEEKAKKIEKSKKGKVKKNDFYEFSKKKKSSKTVNAVVKRDKVKEDEDEDEDELSDSALDSGEVVNETEKIANVKIKKAGKDKKKSKGYYDMDDDFMKDL